MLSVERFAMRIAQESPGCTPSSPSPALPPSPRLRRDKPGTLSHRMGEGRGKGFLSRMLPTPSNCWNVNASHEPPLSEGRSRGRAYASILSPLRCTDPTDLLGRKHSRQRKASGGARSSSPANAFRDPIRWGRGRPHSTADWTEAVPLLEASPCQRIGWLQAHASWLRLCNPAQFDASARCGRVLVLQHRNGIPQWAGAYGCAAFST